MITEQLRDKRFSEDYVEKSIDVKEANKLLISRNADHAINQVIFMFQNNLVPIEQESTKKLCIQLYDLLAEDVSGMITEDFILNAKLALQVQKLRITTSNRVYSAIVERYIRSHPDYPQLLAMRKDVIADRKKTAALVKKLLKEQLESMGLEESEITDLYEQTLEKNETYQSIVKTENRAFKLLEPEMKSQPIFKWFEKVRGLGTKKRD